jgi:hypothetical protein
MVGNAPARSIEQLPWGALLTDESTAGPSRLRVSVHAPFGAARAAEVLGPGRGAWLGELIEEGEPHHLVDLELRVTEHAPRVAFRKAARLEVGAVEGDAADGTVRLPISWRAASLAPLFPVFAGTVTWLDNELLLNGYYEPPGGNVGVAMDRLLLNVAAQATGRRLLERIAEVMRDGD